MLSTRLEASRSMYISTGRAVCACRVQQQSGMGEWVQPGAQPLVVSGSSTGLHGSCPPVTRPAVHVKAAALLRAGLKVKLAWHGTVYQQLLCRPRVWQQPHAAASSMSTLTLLLTISDTTLSCMTWREGESVKCFRFQEPMRATVPGAHGHVSARLLSVLCCCLVRPARGGGTGTAPSPVLQCTGQAGT